MKSYVVSCSSAFRDAVLALSERKQSTVSDLAAAALNLMNTQEIQSVADPGDAEPGDREAVLLKSGVRKGQTLKRKPRLQLRLRSGLDSATLRRALSVALTIDQGSHRLIYHPATTVYVDAADQAPAEELTRSERERDRLRSGNEELRAIIGLLAFEIGPGPVHTVAQARYILGFPPSAILSRETVKARFRLLSRIFHPDKPTGDNQRMGQLIEANRLLDRRLQDGRA